ncbi:hypothetical protein [Sulfurovum riftiae]|uniref:Uncharacterized protein n=1 Tax=Sulfurovum riftiae TaxID=1630136 RepID=A0A151CJ32_9BACT|nr:hypothetical protein [Sulfurovum riftiae]KYJ87536.1 hypothetical protein AS592_10540 [Sulfurovum riftiae]
MSIRQPRLFAYNSRTSEMLVGASVSEAEEVKRKVRILQREKKMIEDWRLDIFCRSPQTITDIIIARNNMNSAAASYGRYCIRIAVTPEKLRSYTLTVAYLQNQQKAEEVSDTVRKYLKLRYGISLTGE